MGSNFFALRSSRLRRPAGSCSRYVQAFLRCYFSLSFFAVEVPIDPKPQHKDGGQMVSSTSPPMCRNESARCFPPRLVSGSLTTVITGVGVIARKAVTKSSLRLDRSTAPGVGPWLFGAQYDLVTLQYVRQLLALANAESFDW